MPSFPNSKEELINGIDDEFEGVIPEHDEPNHAALGFALGSCMGVVNPSDFDHATQSAGSDLIAAIGQPDHAVFLLLDGFGMNFVDTLTVDSYVRRHIAMTMCSTLPTSTGPNLMALSSGRWPGTHGNLGWDVHIPRLGERVQPLPWRLTRTGQPLHEIGYHPKEFLLTEMIPFRDLGLFTFVVDNDLAATTTTQRYGQHRTLGFPKQGDSISQIVRHVLKAIADSLGKSFTYVYWSDVDSCAHTYGERHPITRAAVHRAAALVEVLANAVTGKAKFIATADHGHLDSPRNVWSTIAPDSGLSQLLTCIPSGEPRTLFFHTKRGQRDEFASRFQDQFGDRFTLMPSADAIELGIFGPRDLVSDAARARMGDFFALSRGRWSIYTPDRGHEDSMTLESMHGGITTAESLVPLIVV